MMYSKSEKNYLKIWKISKTLKKVHIVNKNHSSYFKIVIFIFTCNNNNKRKAWLWRWFYIYSSCEARQQYKRGQKTKLTYKEEARNLSSLMTQFVKKCSRFTQLVDRCPDCCVLCPLMLWVHFVIWLVKLDHVTSSTAFGQRDQS
jgi:hypothetical protein